MFRRLSSKTKDEKLSERRGVDNQSFEVDATKSPWRSPIRRLPTNNLSRSHQMIRMDSRDSASSLASSMGLSFLNRERESLPPIPQVHKELTRTYGFVS